MSNARTKTMPDYFRFRGDCDDLALQQAGVFSVEDTIGRNWICFEGSSQTSEIDILMDIQRLQRAAHLKGFSNEGTTLVRINCANIEELKQRLAEH